MIAVVGRQEQKAERHEGDGNGKQHVPESRTEQDRRHDGADDCGEEGDERKVRLEDGCQG